MTTTTTKDRADEEDLVAAAARAQEELAGKSLATMRPEQNRWDEHQVAILRQLGVEDATQGDLDLFFHVCRMTGLDPFRRQIYMIGRNTKVTEWVDDDRATNGRRKVEKWVTKYTIQTGIDGFRRNGREAAKRYGDTLTFDGPYWCGEDGEWREVWPAKQPPVAAKYTVFRNGEPFSAVVHYDEFVQTNPVYEGSGDRRKKVGDEPNSMWAKMPRNQTAKCAEAMSYRRAYPDDFGGLILEDSAQPTVIDQDGNVEKEGRPPRRGRGTSGLKDAAAAAAETEQPQPPLDVETVPTEAGPPQQPQDSDLRKSMRDNLNGAIFATFGELNLNGKDQREDRLVVIRAIVGREVESSKDLTDAELQKLRNGLFDRKRDGTLDADVTDWLNGEDLRRAGIDPDAAGPGDGDTSGEPSV